MEKTFYAELTGNPALGSKIVRTEQSLYLLGFIRLVWFHNRAPYPEWKPQYCIKIWRFIYTSMCGHHGWHRHLQFEVKGRERHLISWEYDSRRKKINFLCLPFLGRVIEYR